MKLRKLIEPILLEYRSRMSIEWKLDWLLKKIGEGKYHIGVKDKETGRETEQAFLKKLYKYPVPTNRVLYDAMHEYHQLVDKIIIEDQLAEEHDSYSKKYTLTIKGKQFRGYVRARRMKWWKDAWTISTSALATSLTVLLIYNGVSELLEKSTPLKSKIKSNTEVLKEDLRQLNFLQYKTPETDNTIQK